MSRLPAQVIASRCRICLGKFIIGLSPPANGKRRKGSRKSPSRFVRKADDTNAVLSNLSEELLKPSANRAAHRGTPAPQGAAVYKPPRRQDNHSIWAVWKAPLLAKRFFRTAGTTRTPSVRIAAKSYS